MGTGGGAESISSPFTRICVYGQKYHLSSALQGGPDDPSTSAGKEMVPLC